MATFEKVCLITAFTAFFTLVGTLTLLVVSDPIEATHSR